MTHSIKHGYGASWFGTLYTKTDVYASPTLWIIKACEEGECSKLNNPTEQGGLGSIQQSLGHGNNQILLVGVTNIPWSNNKVIPFGWSHWKPLILLSGKKCGFSSKGLNSTPWKVFYYLLSSLAMNQVGITGTALLRDCSVFAGLDLAAQEFPRGLNNYRLFQAMLLFFTHTIPSKP